MLSLTRRPGESIEIGADIKVKVRRVHDNQVVLSIKAPPHVGVNRTEVAKRMRAEGLDPSVNLQPGCDLPPDLTATEFRAVLDWRVRSDLVPLPLADVIDNWLTRQCKSRGYSSFGDAHERHEPLKVSA